MVGELNRGPATSEPDEANNDVRYSMKAKMATGGSWLPTLVVANSCAIFQTGLRAVSWS